MKRINWYCSLAILVSLFPVQRASATTTFDGSFYGWTADGSDPVVIGTWGNWLAWGDEADYGTGPSWVLYSKREVPTERVLSGEPFDVGRITYFNGTIRSGTGITAAWMRLSPFPDEEPLDEDFNLELYTVSTPNVGTPQENADYLLFTNYVEGLNFPAFFNVYEGTDASADLVARLDMFTDVTVEDIGPSDPGGRYVLTILGFENLQGDGFLSYYPNTPIPAPSSILLLSTGLPPVLAMVRRRTRRC